MAVTWVWWLTGDLTRVRLLLQALAKAYALAVIPYMVWLMLVWLLLRLTARREERRGSGALLGLSASFWVAYVLVWPLPIAWPFIVNLAHSFTVVGALDPIRPLAYGLFCGVSVMFVAAGLTLTILGLHAVQRSRCVLAGQ